MWVNQGRARAQTRGKNAFNYISAKDRGKLFFGKGNLKLCTVGNGTGGRRSPLQIAVIGIVSRGAGCPLTIDDFAVYTRVKTFKKWINKIDPDAVECQQI